MGSDPSAPPSSPALLPKRTGEEDRIMLWTIAIVLTVLWLLGMITSTTIGGLIHILLVIAVIVVLVQIIRGKR
jgi:hypothetical protein